MGNFHSIPITILGRDAYIAINSGGMVFNRPRSAINISGNITQIQKRHV